jgi:hypothetical protein
MAETIGESLVITSPRGITVDAGRMKPLLPPAGIPHSSILARYYFDNIQNGCWNIH